MDTPSNSGDKTRHRGFITSRARDLTPDDILACLGLHLLTDPEIFDFHGDVVINDDFVVARYSHGPGIVEYRPPENLPKGNRIMIHACLSGSETLHTATGSAVLKPLSVTRVPPEEFTRSECEVAATSMFVIYRSPSAGMHSDMLVGQSNDVYLRILDAAAASLLQNPPDHPQPGLAQVQKGLEELANAVTVGADFDANFAHVDSLTKVYASGLELIRTTATSVDTSIESLARDLKVSRSYLLRAFKAHETSPSAELRRERLESAHNLLGDGASWDEAASGSGFGSVRNLKRALKTGITLD